MSWTLLTVTLVAAVLVAVATAAAGGVVGAELRAQDAADAAALAAVHATVTSLSPVTAARRAAAAHGAVLVACRCATPEVEVTVAVPVRRRAAALTGIGEQRATAAARLVRPPGPARWSEPEAVP